MYTVHGYLPKEAIHQKKEKKLSGSFWEIIILSEKLTTTTDESALEKLRCLSAGGAKKSYRTVSEKYRF